MHLRAKLIIASLLGITFLTGFVAFAQEAIPYVPPERVDRTRRMDESVLRFCVWQNSPLKDFEEAVAQEIAHALLLEPEIVSIGRQPPTNDNDFWEAVYLALNNDCDALMGHILVVNQLPDWLTASRPYYATPAVLAVSGDYTELNAIPEGSLIGSQLATAMDYQLLRYLQSSERQWRRLPYDSMEKLVQGLENGTLEAAVVQEAALYAALDFDPEVHGIHVASVKPLAESSTEFAVAYLSSESSLRTIIDEAIVSLQADEIIKMLAGQLGLPQGL